MHRILLIDDDSVTMDGTGCLLQAEGYEVEWAPTGRDGIRAAEASPPDVALIDLRLPDISGIHVVEAIRKQNPETACAILTGYADLDTAVEAMRAGTVDFLFKPLMGDDLIEAIKRIADKHVHPKPTTIDGQHTELHARARWADVVIRATEAPKDPRTLHDWGRFVGASTGAIRNWCRTARLPARRSLLLARVLRAVIRQQHVSAPPEDLLDIVDRRTMAKLMAASGSTPEALPLTVNAFLKGQHLIEDKAAIGAIHAALAAQPQKTLPTL